MRNSRFIDHFKKLKKRIEWLNKKKNVFIRYDIDSFIDSEPINSLSTQIWELRKLKLINSIILINSIKKLSFEKLCHFILINDEEILFSF